MCTHKHGTGGTYSGTASDVCNHIWSINTDMYFNINSTSIPCFNMFD